MQYQKHKQYYKDYYKNNRKIMIENAKNRYYENKG